MTYCNTPAQLPCCARLVGCLPCLNKDIFKEPIPFYLKLMTLFFGSGGNYKVASFTVARGSILLDIGGIDGGART